MANYDIPERLIQAQTAWYSVYQQLADADNASETTVLRRRLQRLSVQITTDPYWTTIPGRAPAARMALKQMAWQDEGR
ncbi:hypothetical protein GCM10010211_21880 [Streptomyces albospinus]|uniref:Uncharacterized protein n=1 Tax=Streptomyces albospinus TaxID=285515 RepID=A0ABQ2UWU6_9ACTN|nr:hypothetical protein [Streptomyces albospinus]GGU56618.1 hypothetical protein GCM10010211_21880 [Streptomyces albospinus]